MAEALGSDQLERILLSSPYHQWLALRLRQCSAEGIEIGMGWREEMVSNVQIQSTHGGILAGLIDLTGLFTILAAGGRVTATADLRVDYHRSARPGALVARGRPLKLGSRLCTAEVYLHRQDDDALVASGRGAYLNAGA